MAAVAPNLEGRAVLFAKAAPDGSLGNCPYVQKANLALRLRGIPFEVETIPRYNKPQWFLDLTEAGTTPVFVDGKLVLTSSDDIVDYADKVGTEGPVLFDETNPHAMGAKECADLENVLRTFAKLFKNDGAEERAELNAVLKAVGMHLKDRGGKFLLGDNFSAIDCALAPKLWHIQLAGKHYKDVELPERLQQYMRDVQSLSVWAATACPDHVVLSEWA